MKNDLNLKNNFFEKLSDLDNENIKTNILNSSIPEFITKFSIRIPPTELLCNYYSYEGINQLLSNLLKMENNSQIQDLRNGDVFLKISYSYSSLYTLPLLCLDLFFFKKLSSYTIKDLESKLNTDLLILTRGIGEFVILSNNNQESIFEQLDIPKLSPINSLGINELYKEYKISNKVIEEIESIFFGLIPIIKVDIRCLYKDPHFSLFTNYEEIIKERKTLLYSYL